MKIILGGFAGGMERDLQKLLLVLIKHGSLISGEEAIHKSWSCNNIAILLTLFCIHLYQITITVILTGITNL